MLLITNIFNGFSHIVFLKQIQMKMCMFLLDIRLKSEMFGFFLIND